MPDTPVFLIVDAPYYSEISAMLRQGAESAFEGRAATDYIQVGGALEIPAAIAMAAAAAAASKAKQEAYDGYIALGCVIRGKTFHFEIVAMQSARGLMTLAIEKRLAIGNGILTVENEQQAIERAKDKGYEAASAALQLYDCARRFGSVD